MGSQVPSAMSSPPDCSIERTSQWLRARDASHVERQIAEKTNEHDSHPERLQAR